MGELLAGLVVWWQGKKTIVGGLAVVAAGVAGVALGKLDPVTGLGVVGAGVSIAGFSAKANRHQTELLSALQDVSQVAALARAGNKAGAIAGVESAVSQFAPAVLQGSAASLHISADSAGALASAVQVLAGAKPELAPSPGALSGGPTQ